MSKSAIKFYVIPGVIALIIIIVLLLIPLNQKKPQYNITSTPNPTIIINLPTKSIIPNKDTSPTLIPPQPFTGADINQELPINIKAIGEQKTALRRLTPLTLPFATIEFDYVNDIFLVQISKQNEQNSQLFLNWLQQNYPALTQDKFAFR
ncbi:MAG: hypothetical protein NTV98_03705 [Candidatus Roizmanbacteria bacterium]|nr:hypothetical protein [Candidatus Roizmanbacteria bacterium]